MMDATRVMTAGAVDLGEKPAVLSAIAKYHMTERARDCVNDAHGHPRRQGHLPRAEQLARPRLPDRARSAITVEGANILTRTLIIFGQGAIRCHPYVLREMRAAKEMHGAEAAREFDDAFTSHIGHVLRNDVRTLVYGLTQLRLRARFREPLLLRPGTTTATCRACPRPSRSSPTSRCWRWAARSSARRRSPGAWATCSPCSTSCRRRSSATRTRGASATTCRSCAGRCATRCTARSRRSTASSPTSR